MGSLYSELRRRNVFKVAVAYGVVAWLLIQVAGEVFPALRLPDWTPTLVTILLILGFPIALVLAWAFELSPKGIQITPDKRSTGDDDTAGDISRSEGTDTTTDLRLMQEFVVGEWTVQPLSGRIVGPDGSKHVEPRIMDVLVCLAGRPGTVWERDALLREVWGPRAVTDEPLTRCIAELRRLLEDQRKDPKYIQTVPKRGYRLVAAVDVGSGSQPASAASIASQGWRPFVWGALAITVAALLFWAMANREQVTFPIEGATSVGPRTQPSVTVLPFVNRSNDESMEYFSDGVTEDIINLLSTIPDLSVTSRTSSFYFKDKDLDLPDIAHQLGVGAILEGSVRRSGDQVRVIVQLIDVESNTQIDSFRFDRPLGDIFSVQDEIASAVARRLKVSLGRIMDRTPPTTNLQAHQLYLQGRYESWQRTAESMNRAIDLYQHAIELDPEFADAYSELAVTYLALPGYSQRPDDRYAVVVPKALAAAQRALELDPEISSPHAVLAGSVGFQGDIVAARRGLERALSLTPNDPVIRVWYGMMFAIVGDQVAANEQFDWAHRVDPLSGMTAGWVGIGLMAQGRNDEAVPYVETSMALGWPNAELQRARLHIRAREYDRALPLLTSWTNGQGIDPAWASVFISALGEPARRDDAVARIRRLEFTHRDIGPHTYVQIGAVDEAFASARRKIEAQNTSFLTKITDPEFAIFRGDARFKAIAERAGLVNYWDAYGWQGYCEKTADSIRCN